MVIQVGLNVFERQYSLCWFSRHLHDACNILAPNFLSYIVVQLALVAIRHRTDNDYFTLLCIEERTQQPAVRRHAIIFVLLIFSYYMFTYNLFLYFTFQIYSCY